MCTPPIKPCRWRRHFSPQTRINRFVFLNLPILSLVTHLGVTVSPHAPFPTGYVTLSAYDKSPPFRLSSSRNRGRSSISLPPCFRYMYSRHALVPKVPSPTVFGKQAHTRLYPSTTPDSARWHIAGGVHDDGLQALSFHDYG